MKLKQLRPNVIPNYMSAGIRSTESDAAKKVFNSELKLSWQAKIGCGGSIFDPASPFIVLKELYSEDIKSFFPKVSNPFIR